MKKIALAAAAALTAGSFGLAAIAQDESDFSRADGNKDGVVSYAEAVGSLNLIDRLFFDQADANGDGVLDEAEYISLQTLAVSLGTSVSSSSSSEESSMTSSEMSSEEPDESSEEPPPPPV